MPGLWVELDQVWGVQCGNIKQVAGCWTVTEIYHGDYYVKNLGNCLINGWTLYPKQAYYSWLLAQSWTSLRHWFRHHVQSPENIHLGQTSMIAGRHLHERCLLLLNHGCNCFHTCHKSIVMFFFCRMLDQLKYNMYAYLIKHPWFSQRTWRWIVKDTTSFNRWIRTPNRRTCWWPQMPFPVQHVKDQTNRKWGTCILVPWCFSLLHVRSWA